MARITDKNTLKEILEIGVPSFLETLFSTFANIIDSKMVSAMGVAAISAVSVTNPPRLFIFSVFFALNTVVTSLVAKSLGENDRDKANRIFDGVMKIVTVLSIAATVFSVVLARPLMLLFSHQMDTIDDSTIYFRIVMAGMIFNTIFMAVNAALRGCGHTKETFVSNVIFCGVNILFNYLLIEGHMGFPALGIRGAAIATVAGMVAACIFTVIMGCRKDLFVNIPYCLKGKYKVTWESTAKVRELSKSTITDGLVTRVSILIIGAIVARIGSYQTAVYAVGMHLMNVNTALGMGLQTAGVALVGRSFGAKNKDQMDIYKSSIVKLGAACAIVLGAAIILGGKWFYSFFSDDPEFISMGAKSCLFIGAITLSQTIKFAYTGILQGVGAMKEVMTASIVSFSVVNLGTLAFLVFVLKMGIWGTWTASLVAQAVQALMLWRYTRKNEAFRGVDAA